MEGKEPPFWSVTGSIGYTSFEDMYQGDGETAVGRFAIARNLFKSNQLNWGMELGVQNGKSMRFFPSKPVIDPLGGLPIQTIVKPMLDLLVTAQTSFFNTTPLFGVLKGGAAYCHWQINNRDSINDLSQLAGEVQAGLGYSINKKTDISLSYQGIFGANPDFKLNTMNETGHVNHIPIQHGVLLSLTFKV